MKVYELLPKVKATSGIYYNLTKSQQSDFKKLYSYLLKHKNKDVCKIVETLINDYLKNIDCQYLVKFKAMQFISTNIIH